MCRGSVELTTCHFCWCYLLTVAVDLLNSWSHSVCLIYSVLCRIVIPHLEMYAYDCSKLHHVTFTKSGYFRREAILPPLHVIVNIASMDQYCLHSYFKTCNCDCDKQIPNGWLTVYTWPIALSNVFYLIVLCTSIPMWSNRRQILLPPPATTS